MILVDFQCKNCGNSKQDVLVKDETEIIKCEVCDAKMERLYTQTIYKRYRPNSGTPVPTSLLGGGNRANFGVLK
jgi:formate dehydrogenase maturation protein FdhE